MPYVNDGTDSTQDMTFFPGVSAGNGTLTSDTAHVYTGLRALKSDVTLTGGFARALVPAVLSDTMRHSVRLLFSTTAPSVNTAFMFYTTANNAAQAMAFGIDTTGVLRMCFDGVASKAGKTVLTALTFYRICVSVNIVSTTNFTINLYLQQPGQSTGVLEIQLTNADGTLNRTGISDFKPGINDAVGSYDANIAQNTAVMTVWYDNFFANTGTDTLDPGDVECAGKRTFANGTTNGFTTQIGAGGSGYGSGHAPQVNEQPLNTANGWSMVGAGAAVTEEYNIEGQSVGDVNIPVDARIVGAEAWVYAAATVNETASMVADGGTGTNIALTNTPTLFTNDIPVPTQYPAGTGTDIGIITTTALSTVSLYECGIMIAFIRTKPAAGYLKPNHLRPAPFKPGLAR
jgi:hypothetical protein